MLKLMGIDVWFERPTAAELAGRTHVVGETTAPDVGLNPASVPPKRSAGTPRHKAQVPPAVPAETSYQEATAKPVENVAVGDEVLAEPFSLLCFRGSGAILVCTPPQGPNRQRLGRDIVKVVSTLSGAASAKPAVIEFVYPPQAGSGRSASTPPDRVLRAFMTRQLADLQGPRVLISADAMIRFRGWFKEPCTVIPSLEELFGDAVRKQDLWQLLLRSGRD
jgi:hypothetical protein